MKILNTMLGRQAIAAALVLSLAIPMSVGAFAEEPAAAAAADDTVVAGYLPPQDERVMLQARSRCTAATLPWARPIPPTAATAHRRVTPSRATSC